MKIDEIISKKIDVETDRFKTYVIVVVVLTTGLYGLLININENVINQVFFILGSAILAGLFFGIIYSFFRTKNFFKELQEKK